MTFICKECNKTIPISSKHYHLKTAHNMSVLEYKIKNENFIPIVCDICNAQCMSKHILSIHKKNEHNIMPARFIKHERIKSEKCHRR